jgi:hypothetical protein
VVADTIVEEDYLDAIDENMKLRMDIQQLQNALYQQQQSAVYRESPPKI